jgi:hypothetical protein
MTGGGREEQVGYVNDMVTGLWIVLLIGRGRSSRRVGNQETAGKREAWKRVRSRGERETRTRAGSRKGVAQTILDHLSSQGRAMHTLVDDLRYAAAPVPQEPRFLEDRRPHARARIGLNTAVFSVIDGLADRSPGPRSNELVQYTARTGATPRCSGPALFTLPRRPRTVRRHVLRRNAMVVRDA